MVSNMLSGKWNSDMKNIRYFSFIILSITFQSLSGIFGKYAALSLPAPSLIGIVTNAFYILSLGCLFLQAIVWQQALRHFPLSVAYPFMGLVNFVVLFSSAILFQEGVTLANIMGLVLITVGIAVLSHEIGDAA
jgi:multidrug transporter EmrE-like cation transporter